MFFALMKDFEKNINLEEFMKNERLIGIFAIYAVIGLLMIACSGEGSSFTSCSHNWGGDVVTPPTCKDRGYTTQTCSMCKDTREINYTDSAHSWGDDKVIVSWGDEEILAPTCWDGGYGYYGYTRQTCSMCKTTRKINYINEKGDHKWGNDELTVPTCVDEGYTTQTCFYCRDTQQIDIISALEDGLGHDWSWNTYSSGIRYCQRDNGCLAAVGVGDTGPAGGKIFYVSTTGFWLYTSATNTTGRTAYYLEAANENMPTRLRVITATQRPYPNFPFDVLIGRDAIGTGRRNTAIILAGDPTAPAALACADYGNGTDFDDWFLPSRDELDVLCKERIKLNILSGLLVTSSVFPSSTPTLYAQIFNITYNSPNGFYTYDSDYNVRAIRAF